MTDAIAPTSNYFAAAAAQQAQQAAASGAAAPSGGGGISADADTFLQLLVAQMRYQNPMEPMKGTEFISQSAQLATVQSLQAMQAAQASASQWAQVGAAHQMLGTQVSATGPDGAAVTGVATSVAVGTAGARLTLTTPDGPVEVALDAVRSTTLPTGDGGRPATTLPS